MRIPWSVWARIPTLENAQIYANCKSTFLPGSAPKDLPQRSSVFQLTLFLVGGFNPFEKHARQIGSFPQVEVKIKHI